MCEWGKEVVLDLPDGFCDWRQNRTVSIDECIAETIKMLWSNGVVTLGCCCGHGKENPSVVIGEGYGEDGVRKIADLLRTNDSRPWTIYQWRLSIVAMTLLGGGGV